LPPPGLLQGGHSQCVAVHVAVVGQHGDRDRRILVGGGGVVLGRGRVVDRAHSDPHRGRVHAAAAIADCVGENVLAEEICLGSVGEAGAVCAHATVGCLGDGANLQGVPIHVLVVAQHGHTDGPLLIRDGGVVPGLGRVVDIRGRTVTVDGHLAVDGTAGHVPSLDTAKGGRRIGAETHIRSHRRAGPGGAGGGEGQRDEGSVGQADGREGEDRKIENARCAGLKKGRA
jgi:hypothetical protein